MPATLLLEPGQSLGHALSHAELLACSCSVSYFQQDRSINLSGRLGWIACLQTWQSCVDSVADGPEGAADEETRKQAVEKCSAVVSSLKRLLI